MNVGDVTARAESGGVGRVVGRWAGPIRGALQRSLLRTALKVTVQLRGDKISCRAAASREAMAAPVVLGRLDAAWERARGPPCPLNRLLIGHL